MQTQTTAYVIRNTQFEFPVYIGEQETTRLVGYAKVWRTVRGAQRWIAERGYPGEVVSVVAQQSKRNQQRLYPLGEAC